MTSTLLRLSSFASRTLSKDSSNLNRKSYELAISSTLATSKCTSTVHVSGKRLQRYAKFTWGLRRRFHAHQFILLQTGLSLKELCDPFDSVSLCMSKGLGAPIGR